jgi:hypothetical protein
VKAEVMVMLVAMATRAKEKKREAIWDDKKAIVVWVGEL